MPSTGTMLAFVLIPPLACRRRGVPWTGRKWVPTLTMHEDNINSITVDKWMRAVASACGVRLGQRAVYDQHSE
jgi:hypothetical protein